VDAICINQCDETERAAQVLRMAGIYAGAKTVLVVIETERKQASELLRVLPMINPVLPAHKQDLETQRVSRDPTIQSALQQYCSAEYWKRIWIIQEFAIGNKITLLIGDSLVDARNLDLMLQLSNEDQMSSVCRSARAVFTFRKSWQSRKAIRLLDALEQTVSSRCGRRVDRVYGLLGLVPDFLDFLSEPNYGTSLINLTVSMTQSFIERRSLDIILFAQHHGCCLDVPSWSPNFFRFDRHPPEARILALALSNQESKWTATGDTIPNYVIQGTTLTSTAHRIGYIRSLGRAWSDAADSQFPIHDQTSRKPRKACIVGKEMAKAMLNANCRYNSVSWLQKGRQYREHSFLYTFRASHGEYDPGQLGGELLKWICANRDFYAHGSTLAQHAERLRSIILHYGPTLLVTACYMERDKHAVFDPLIRMAKKDMRMMCLDVDTFGINWATRGARLHDEVFLLPGCSVPVILRSTGQDGQYRLIGDAIVIGAMIGEVWETLNPSQFPQIEII
jgi:hypothetical protein